MKRNLFSLAALLWLCVLSLQVSGQDKKAQLAIIAFYNIENLFDTIDDPITIDEEFLPGGLNDWTSEKYNAKLAKIAEVISKLGTDVVPGGPAIVGLSEIENREVVQDLINTEPLKSMGYDIIHFNSPDRRGVDVGMIYQKKRFVPMGSKSFRLTSTDTSFRTRDQLLAWGKLDGEMVYLHVNHWPSRRGGEQRSAPRRKEAALLARSVIDSLISENPNVKFILMGDLNDNPNNASITKYLKAKGNKKDVVQGDLFDPMYKLFSDGIGSYAYKDSWDLYDQIIVSWGLFRPETGTYGFMQAKVYNENYLKQKTGTFAGYPWRSQVAGQYLGGYSDHFPVYIILGREVK